MRQNNLTIAAKYALQMMQDHAESNKTSLGFDCAMSLLRDALDLPISSDDMRNMNSVGYYSKENS